MKYWFFDGKDVSGPYLPKELAKQKGFCATSLICPEDFSEDGDQWQMAARFEDVSFFLAQSEEPQENSSTFDEELDSLLTEKSPLNFDETSTDNPSLQLPKKPIKPGPIEDYFNHIKQEDLGGILGIPKPSENSDMDLAHVLEKQLAKTSSTRREKQENTEEQPSEELPQAQQTHHVASVTEVFNLTTKFNAESSPAKQEPATQKPADATMPVVEPATMPTVETPLTVHSQTQAIQEPQELVGTAPELHAAQTQSKPEPEVKQEPITNFDTPEQAAQKRAAQLQVDTVNARLKQTKEMKDFLRQTQQDRLKKQQQAAAAEHKSGVLFLTLLVIVIGIGSVFFLRRTYAPAPQFAPVAQKVLSEDADQAPVVAPVVTTPTVASLPEPAQDQKALAIAQNYLLSGNRGTLAHYLNHLYQPQLSQGYTDTWQAEQLHKNTYVVKYQLTKMRKEPIIYIFQVDVGTNRLTGALNNIALDLVGKI